MGSALVGGLLDAGWARPDQVEVVEVSPAQRGELTGEDGLAKRYPGLRVVDQTAACGPARGAVLAVKPADMEAAGRSLEGAGVSRVLSIAAGVTLGAIESWCPPGCAVVRAMPNIAALVKAGATAISPGPSASAEDVEWAAAIMRSVGLVVEVPEKLLDAVTGLSGSGPAYVFLVVEAMTEAGVLEGLPRPIARDLVVQTLAGAAQLLSTTGQSAEELPRRRDLARRYDRSGAAPAGSERCPFRHHRGRRGRLCSQPGTRRPPHRHAVITSRIGRWLASDLFLVRRLSKRAAERHQNYLMPCWLTCLQRLSVAVWPRSVQVSRLNRRRPRSNG